MQKKQKQQKRRLKKIARFHIIFSASLFIFYIGLSLIYSPEFLFSDVRTKFQALADETIMITGKVLSPPLVPIVSGLATCNNGTLSVTLAWSADENSDRFNISRNGVPLVTGLADSHYKDEIVTTGTIYTYKVTAYGPMGSGMAISMPVAVSTPAECAIVLPAPVVSVASIFGKNIFSQDGFPETTELRPEFSGTTNIPNANIYLLIHSDILASANIQANENGYWSWKSPVDIALGTHTIFIFATDPLDGSRTASISQTFNVVKEKSKTSSSLKKSSSHKLSNVTQDASIADKLPTIEDLKMPLDFSFTIEKDTIFQGKELPLRIDITRLEEKYKNAQGVVKYTILDENGQISEIFSDDVVLYSGETIVRNIPIPTFYKDGHYSVQVEILLGKYNISQIKSFSVLPLPVLNFGGGVVATYPELLSQIGTVSLWLMLTLIMWLLLFSREYWLYLHALTHITENNLVRVGLFGARKRKGVTH